MVAQKQQGRWVGIITMIFLFGMISFVTNLAAPIGVIWKNTPGFENLGAMGNFMNFFAYLFMGIPAGNMLAKLGYKKTALVAIAVGLVGIFVQYLSGKTGAAGIYVYLTGAFIAGICVCLLNTVVNPMLNILGGEGKAGVRLLNLGGGFNSLMATVTPMMVGALIGDATKAIFSNVNPLLFAAMGIFALTFVILLFVPVPEIHKKENVVLEKSPWAFRHFVLGAFAIFCYVGVEVAIPGTLNFYLADSGVGGGGLPVESAAATAGIVAGMYWFLMMIGRFIGGALGVSAKTMMTFSTAIAAVLVVAAIFMPSTIQASMPVLNGTKFEMARIPLSALLLVLCGLCTSVMWGSIFNLATAGLGKYVPKASGIFMMMVVGGGVFLLLQDLLTRMVGYMPSYWLIVAGILYMLFYALVGSKNVNKDIKVD